MIKDSLTYNQIIKDLDKRIFHPIYFLSGDEPYYIDKISGYIMENVLTDAEKSFNQSVFYGKDTEAATIINAARRFPMMASQQVVILKEAQELKNFEDLVYYFENPLNSTILVINYKYKTLDKRKKIFKTIRDNALVFESKKLYDDKVPGWIADELSRKGYKIEPKAAALLTEFLGNDLSRIENELSKLIIVLPDNVKIITVDHIERNIGISKEYNNFELQKALTEKDVVKANRIIRYFASNPKNNHITQTITNLYFFYSKILTYHVLTDKSERNVAAVLRVHPFFVKEYVKAARACSPGKTVKIISLLREYDVKSKGYGNVSAGSGDLLKELVFKIMH
ncbi:MAG TPA: DNA polymerase III subunit delta [Bacteroidales bacterium]|nr:DNA polymerase III subunit delta [Bacteroidales bacterium]